MFVRRGLFRPAQPTGTSDGLHQRSARSKKAEAKETWLLCKGPEVQPRHCGKWSSTRILLTGCSGTIHRSSSFLTWIWQWTQIEKINESNMPATSSGVLLDAPVAATRLRRLFTEERAKLDGLWCWIQLVEHSTYRKEIVTFNSFLFQLRFSGCIPFVSSSCTFLCYMISIIKG